MRIKDGIPQKDGPSFASSVSHVNNTGAAALSPPLPIFAELLDLKRKIDEPPYQEHWEEFKKLLSPFELVHVSRNTFRHMENIANVVPLSRSYFKMVEMIHDFGINDLIMTEEPIRTAHVAEGPGGFIEATCHCRQRYHAHIADEMHGITLMPCPVDDKKLRDTVPGWSTATSFLRRFSAVKLHTGHDGTGDLCNMANMDAFVCRVGEHSCALVTGDGGFDFSGDFSKQEERSLLLIMCEVYTCLRLVAHGGTLVCKFFDTQMQATVDVINLVSCAFKTISITKPAFSRPANSERYLVAQHYHGEYIHEILNVLKRTIVQLCCGTTTEAVCRLFSENDPRVVELVRDYNLEHVRKQSGSIKGCLAMIDTYNSDTASSQEELFSTIMKEQVECGYKWCEKYNIDTNPNCIYTNTKRRCSERK
jgi:hypothetical protein